MTQESPSQEGLKTLATKLQDIHDNADKIASHPDNQFIITGVKAALRKLLNKLNFLAGITHSTEFKPLPPIIIGEQHAPIDHNIDRDEKQLFLHKVEQLYLNIITIDPSGLLTDVRLPEDEMVLRGVAKKAGLENFEDAELTVEFVEAIQEAVRENEATQREALELEERIKAEAEKVNIKGQDGVILRDEFEENFLDEFEEEEFEEGEYTPLTESERAAADAIFRNSLKAAVAATEKNAQQEQQATPVNKPQEKVKPGPKPKPKP